MPIFAVHTEETVHGVYHIKATAAQEAADMLKNGMHIVLANNNLRNLSWWNTYEIMDMEIEKVELVE